MDGCIENAGRNDKRVAKTKAALRDSLFQLLFIKSINQISVSELTRLAGVNRSTFYFYYQDIYDMMEQVQDDIYMSIVHDIVSTDCKFDGVEDYTVYMERFLEFCRHNYTVCNFITTSNYGYQITEKIKRELKKTIPDSTKVFDKKDPRHYLTTFALSGMLWSIIEWMNDGMEIPPHEMASFLSQVYVYGGKKLKETYRK